MTTSEVSEHISQPLSFAERQLVTSLSDDIAGSGGCSTCDASGAIHAFWAGIVVDPQSGQPGTPDRTPISYLSGQPDALGVRDTGLKGWPLAAAANAGTAYLLYSNSGGVHLTKLAADGTFGPGSLLSPHHAVQGALVADGGWWAAWIEDQDSRLYEAHGGWGNGEFPREPITSELTRILYYDSPSLALGPRNPAASGRRWIYLAWAMSLETNANVLRLAKKAVVAAGWLEQAWLPSPATHGFVSSPALAYDGALQAAFDEVPGVDYMRNPSHTAAAQRLTTRDSYFPTIAASGGRTVVAWASADRETPGDLWAAEPSGPAVRLTSQPSYVSIFGLSSHAGSATLLTFEDGNGLYARVQMT